MSRGVALPRVVSPFVCLNAWDGSGLVGVEALTLKPLPLLDGLVRERVGVGLVRACLKLLVRSVTDGVGNLHGVSPDAVNVSRVRMTLVMPYMYPCSARARE